MKIAVLAILVEIFAAAFGIVSATMGEFGVAGALFFVAALAVLVRKAASK